MAFPSAVEPRGDVIGLEETEGEMLLPIAFDSTAGTKGQIRAMSDIDVIWTPSRR
jgi:hypothetical protein